MSTSTPYRGDDLEEKTQKIQTIEEKKVLQFSPFEIQQAFWLLQELKKCKCSRVHNIHLSLSGHSPYFSSYLDIGQEPKILLWFFYGLFPQNHPSLFVGCWCWHSEVRSLWPGILYGQASLLQSLTLDLVFSAPRVFASFILLLNFSFL